MEYITVTDFKKFFFRFLKNNSFYNEWRYMLNIYVYFGEKIRVDKYFSIYAYNPFGHIINHILMKLERKRDDDLIKQLTIVIHVANKWEKVMTRLNNVLTSNS